jgi:hypothetical protein
MGWVVWLTESALCLVASYLVAVALYHDRSVLDRFITTVLVSSTLVLVALHAVGIANRLEPVTLGIVALALFSATAALAWRAAGRARVRESLRHDLAAPWRLVREAWTLREPAVLTLVTATIITAICVVMVWYFRSWTWDPVWYHVPKTHNAIQEHTLRHVPVANPWTSGNPHNVEILAVWNCVFQRDNRLDDSSQLPFLLMGAAAVAAWARRVGASRPLAAGVGAAWITLPPIFLQAHSTHVDVAWNAMFTAAVYFMLGTPERRDRWMCYLCWALFLGTKYTGAFHLALMSPILAGRVAYEVWKARGRRWRVVGDVLLSVAMVLALASFKYVQNWFVHHNPLYPFGFDVKPLGLHFEGHITMESEYGGGTHRPTFFGTPHALQDLVSSWYDSNPFYCPDVRSGGFGTAWRWLLLPCMVIVVGDLVRLRNWRRAWMPVWLFVQAVQVPVPYMSRFVISAASAALVAFVLVHDTARSRAIRTALSLALVVLTWIGYREAYRGWIVYPRYLRRAMEAAPDERAALQIDTFLWPTRWGLARERELGPGDVLTYDESVHFLGDLYSHDYDHRVVYVPSSGDPRDFVRRVQALRARWVGVRSGSAAEQALRATGAEYLFQTPDSYMVMYRMPRPGAPTPALPPR